MKGTTGIAQFLKRSVPGVVKTLRTSWFFRFGDVRSVEMHTLKNSFSKISSIQKHQINSDGCSKDNKPKSHENHLSRQSRNAKWLRATPIRHIPWRSLSHKVVKIGNSYRSSRASRNTWCSTVYMRVTAVVLRYLLFSALSLRILTYMIPEKASSFIWSLKLSKRDRLVYRTISFSGDVRILSIQNGRESAVMEKGVCKAYF